jgi:hypothetical protein
MIDSATGEIGLDSGESIGPSLTLKAFLASPLAGGACPHALSGGTPWSIFDLGRRAIGGQTFAATLRFEGAALRMVQLSLVQSTASSSWDDWSEDTELARKARHDAWLEGQLGALPWWRSWGEVRSVYDPRGGSSSIQITYDGRALDDGTAAAGPHTTHNRDPALAVTMGKATGEIALDTGERIGPQLTLTAFLASPLARGAAQPAHPGGTPWSAFAVQLCMPAEQAFSLTLYFDGDALRQITLSMIGPHEPPATDYRREWANDVALAALVRANELARQARHDAWLQAQLGPSPWSYSWGTISSRYDQAFCQSLAIVAYR